MMKIGLLGGTFDPIHNGHLHLAHQAVNQEKLDRIIFIPARDPWMKSDTNISSPYIRKHMIDISIEDCPNFFSSDIELKRDGPTHTSDTLGELSAGNIEGHQFFLILGSDSIKTFSLWNNPKKILGLSKIIVADRHYEGSTTLLKELSDISEKLIFLQSKMLDISSSEIRNRISDGKTIEGLVPEHVSEYIIRSNIYR